MNPDDRLFDKMYGCIVGGTIGDAIGGPTEMMHYQTIERLYGRVTDLIDYGPACLYGHAGWPAGHWTDDSIVKLILCDAIIRCQGRITAEDWGDSWREMLNPRDVYVSPINAYFRLVNDRIPARDVGRGNMQANGTAMCIAPLGAINACDPFQAAYDTFEVGSLLHSGLAREAGAAIAAAVAEAFKITATPGSILDAATAYLTPRSGAAETLEPMFALARSVDSPRAFTVQFYEQFVRPVPYRPLHTDLVPEGYIETVDPLETVGAALGLFYVCGGDPEQTLVDTANFGHDCDSLGSINGAVAGAYAGAAAMPEKWRKLVDEVNNVDHRQVSADMYRALLNHKAHLESQIAALDTLLQN